MDNTELESRIINPEKPVEVKCPQCRSKVGEYRGSIGWNARIFPAFYFRIDGTQPIAGESAMRECPACRGQVNEIIATATAVNQVLNEDTENAASDSDSGQCTPDNAISNVREASQDT